ncbi:MAG: hypothetical protein DMG05_07330 [Acidobacteria bacterium]|nr:MAG: hypothetical protein DMG05_07330 [Acidobacteriota bacterium]
MTKARKIGAAEPWVGILLGWTLASSLLFLSICSKDPTLEEAQKREGIAQVEAYKSKIVLSRIGLAKGENYLGQIVYYVEGTVKNEGERIVQRIDLTFLFKDSLNQVVLKETRKTKIRRDWNLKNPSTFKSVLIIYLMIGTIGFLRSS